MEKSYSKAVKIWLFIGLVMIVIQILVGGITRLTGSGLSITKWDIVTGTIPPLNETQWAAEFDLYRETPQYQKINEGMSLGQFKFIFFWEYIHRLWARLMGFVFLFPFLYFLIRKKIDRPLMLRLAAVVGMAAVVALFGWIMVASGLVERPWVNAYKLTLHLNLALFLFAILLHTWFYSLDPEHKSSYSSGLGMLLNVTLILLIGQLILGGVMSGMKAGLYYPTWPDMNGQLIPSLLLNSENWSWSNFKLYDIEPIAPALTQFLHRLFAYTLTGLGIAVFVRGSRAGIVPQYRLAVNIFFGVLIVQVLLGILTVINCIGSIPLWLGVMHQLGAIALLSSILYLRRITASA